MHKGPQSVLMFLYVFLRVFSVFSMVKKKVTKGHKVGFVLNSSVFLCDFSVGSVVKKKVTKGHKVGFELNSSVSLRAFFVLFVS